MCVLSQAIHEFLLRKTAKEVWRLASASIAVRNFPLSAEELRKVLRIKDGNAGYLFGCTLADGRKVVLSAGRSAITKQYVKERQKQFAN